LSRSPALLMKEREDEDEEDEDEDEEEKEEEEGGSKEEAPKKLSPLKFKMKKNAPAAAKEDQRPEKKSRS
ncbi:hypothetical protein CYMTET_42684, partial [Cymbomonas tetramitiformis]